jgi:hypothetical protein
VFIIRTKQYARGTKGQNFRYPEMQIVMSSVISWDRTPMMFNLPHPPKQDWVRLSITFAGKVHYNSLRPSPNYQFIIIILSSAIHTKEGAVKLFSVLTFLISCSALGGGGGALQKNIAVSCLPIHHRYPIICHPHMTFNQTYINADKLLRIVSRFK